MICWRFVVDLLVIVWWLLCDCLMCFLRFVCETFAAQKAHLGRGRLTQRGGKGGRSARKPGRTQRNEESKAGKQRLEEPPNQQTQAEGDAQHADSSPSPSKNPFHMALLSGMASLWAPKSDEDAAKPSPEAAPSTRRAFKTAAGRAKGDATVRESNLHASAFQRITTLADNHVTAQKVKEENETRRAAHKKEEEVCAVHERCNGTGARTLTVTCTGAPARAVWLCFLRIAPGDYRSPQSPLYYGSRSRSCVWQERLRNASERVRQEREMKQAIKAKRDLLRETRTRSKREQVWRCTATQRRPEAVRAPPLQRRPRALRGCIPRSATAPPASRACVI